MMNTYVAVNRLSEDHSQADVTDDSCRLEFIEIVPLTTDTTQCDIGHWSDDVKQEIVVKQESDDVRAEYIHML